MRRGVVLAVALCLLACRRGERRAPPSPAGGVASVTQEAAGSTIVENGRGYPVRTWTFPLERYELAILDVHMTSTLGAALERAGADVVANGGFFDKDGRPVGLAISGGERLSPIAPSLSGGVVTIDDERAQLLPTEGFVLPENTRFAVQCRPRLVVDGVANVRSDDGKRAERTALCLRDGGRTIELVVVRADDAADEAGPSLFALARWLEQRPCEAALNLDGGPSSGVAWREGDETRVLAPRAPIRHAVAFRRR